MGEADFRGVKSRLAAELRMFIIDVHDMKIDADTVDFVTDRAGGLVAKIEDAVNERELNRIESDLGRLQVVIHQALKRHGNQAAPSGLGGRSDG